MLDGNMKLENSSEIRDIQKLSGHNPITFNKPEIAGSRNNGKLSLFCGEDIGTLDFEGAPFVFTGVKHNGKHQVQPFAVKLGVDVHALRPSNLFGAGFGPHGDGVVHRHQRAEVEDAGGGAVLAGHRHGGGVVAGEVVVDVESEVGFLAEVEGVVEEG